MTKRRISSLHISTLAVSTLLLAGCAGNSPYRTKDLSGHATPFQSCNAEYYKERGFMDVCDESYYSTYRHREDGIDYDFDLAFVEFTERGAVFDEKVMDDVINKIGSQTTDDVGVTAVVYVHGWKNNASAANGNVKKFRELLAKTAKLQHELSKGSDSKPRKLVGVYIGWRGASLEVQPFDQLTYWDRKAVAEEVGKGGVTELLLRLERILRNEDEPNKNLYLVTGHSFGAAVVLTGLNEIFLERIISADHDGNKCYKKTAPFGHGVALLNPAIETSEILELKQLAAQNCFHKNQERLMHVISSDADAATTDIFEAAQWLGLVIGWNQARFDRTFTLPDQTEKKIRFDEAEMDTTTIGNYAPFLTGYLFAKDSEYAEEHRFTETCTGDVCVVDKCIAQPRGGTWDYVAFKRSEDCFRRIFKDKVHVPISDHEPLAFIKTDEGFIGDHNDVFNENVAAYLATIVAENRFIRARTHWNKMNTRKTAYEGPKACHPKGSEASEDGQGLWFEFGPCFDAYHEAFCELGEGENSLGRHETCGKRQKKS
ncbi:MAG: hypothetical protein ACR2QH_09075 [Geminicoccaceae bacterium]